MHSRSGSQGSGTERACVARVTVLQRGSGECAKVSSQRSSGVKGLHYFVGEGHHVGHARWPQLWGRRAIINARISQGSVHRVAIVRTGMLWPSLVRWLVILIGGSSPGVGACEAEAGSMYAQGHRRLGAVVRGGQVCIADREAKQQGIVVPFHRP